MTCPLHLFIDFDGVICNSAAECLFSSWVAYHRLTLDANLRRTSGRSTSTPPSVPIALRTRFLHQRPFIRAGDDYVLIQHLLAGNHAPSCQEEFDQARREAGPQTLARYADMLNCVRQDLMAHDRAHWLRLNPLYPDVADLLRSADWETTWILSTKRPEYIEAILAFHQVPVPSNAILHAANATKLDMVVSSLDDHRDERAALVDDQLDHLIGNGDPRVEVYLAAWGYAKPEWLEDPRVPPLDIPNLRGLLARARTEGKS